MVMKRANYYFERLNSIYDFDQAASISEGIIKGSAMKFIIDNQTQPAKVYFINGNYLENSGQRPEYVQYHYNFIQKLLGKRIDAQYFNQHTYFTNDIKQKKFIAGTLQKYESLDPNKKSFFGIQFYAQDHIAEKNIAYAARIVKNAISFKDLPFAFVSYGSQQTTKDIVLDLKAIDIEVKTVEQVYAGIPYISMNPGVAYGYLRMYPRGISLENLNQFDIPVFDELPLDLSVVAGVITSVVQDAGAHINLKSKERNTPNMVLRDKSQLAELQKLNGLPVRLKILSNKYEIEPISNEEIAIHIAKTNGKNWTSIKNDNREDIYLFDEMAKLYSPLKLTQEAGSYGGKSAKLAFLAHSSILGIGSPMQKKLQYRMTPMGLAIPVKYYFDFMQANPELAQKIQLLVDSEMGRGGAVTMSKGPEDRLQKIAEIQNMFYKSTVPPKFAQYVTDKITELKAFAEKTYPKSTVKKVKVRSSANAEDIPNFDGAGLHSSYSAKLSDIGNPQQDCRVVKTTEGVETKEEMEPETIMCAIKGVYASLWNKRAIDERNFARIDQSSAAMGIAINASYDFRKKTELIKEIANAVIVTRVVNAKGIYGYRLSVNSDENLVTNPTPNTQSEIIVASFIEKNEVPQLSFIQFAKIDAVTPVRKEPLLQASYYQRMVEIARDLETNYCRHIRSYYSGDCDWVTADPEKSTSLDMEFKIYSNGEILVKQVREFSGR